MKVLLIFPHQLFHDHPGLDLQPQRVWLSEDPLFFADKQYPRQFHAQKLILHRASMRHYAQMLADAGHQVDYFEHATGESPVENVLSHAAGEGVTEICVCDVVDFALRNRLNANCKQQSISLTWLQSPGFINTNEQNTDYRAGKKRWFMADYYRWQRQRLDTLVDDQGQPIGGKWSFDEENRKKIPKRKLGEVPALEFPAQSGNTKEAIDYVAKNFPAAFGNGEVLLYPHTHEQASAWLEQFLEQRLADFGPFEDAIVEDHNWLYHSVLTPMLNIGLLTPEQVLSQILDYADKHDTPIASLEGFVRQVIGWREFMRATYTDIGVEMRTTNHWQHHNPMPEVFYDGSSGIVPVDNTIKRVLETGYCHHIERLMVLGGFMFLCEIDPDAIYSWFMELFVDSYDWVMVPNVYAMSQNADGGLITTKPYFSGSNYVRKMSHYPKGDWSDIWDALYWRWIIIHSKDLGKNPRWAMMVRTAEKFDDAKREQHLQTAQEYLDKLRSQ